MTTGRQAAR